MPTHAHCGTTDAGAPGVDPAGGAADRIRGLAPAMYADLLRILAAFDARDSGAIAAAIEASRATVARAAAGQ